MLERLSDFDFLDDLDRAWQRDRVLQREGVLPFEGGWFLYLGYELSAQIETRLSLPEGEGGLPVAFATRFPAAMIRDHVGDRVWLVAEEPAEERIGRMLQDLSEVGCTAVVPDGILGAVAEEPPERFLEGLAQVHRYIRAGDVFQVNLSRGWGGSLGPGVNACDVYQRLRRCNPAPFAGLATWRECTILSSSPERLVRARGDWVETRPIAGTRPRHRLQATDQMLRGELLVHPKERAEHIMLVDLERNDLGRISRLGTVHVSELLTLESYAHVHHMVSNVRGRLRSGVTPGQVIRAVFTGGTITGCPKVRCMQIIAELEGCERRAYTGSMGYLNRDGSLDLNILIRTLTLEGRRVSLRAGAGIVADSVGHQEVAETRSKAAGMLRALEIPDEQARSSGPAGAR
jgi:anthranilate synthase component 1